MIRAAWTNWGTQITLKGFKSTCCGILCVSESLFVIRRTGTGAGTPSYGKLGGTSNITNMTYTNDDTTFTVAANSCMAAFWISNNDPGTTPS